MSSNNRLDFEEIGKAIGTTQDEVVLEYIRDVKDPEQMDPLFVELVILHMQKNLAPAYSDRSTSLRNQLNVEIRKVMSEARKTNSLLSRKSDLYSGDISLVRYGTSVRSLNNKI